MCGRYTLATDGQTLANEFGVEDLAGWEPRFNVAPSQAVAAIVRRDDELKAARLHWGLVPGWSKDKKSGARAINARAETVAEKPSFRAAFAKRRCLVLADGYYEWVKQGDHKQPYYIARDPGIPFAFAGLWERWVREDDPPYYSCSIVTCAASEDLAGLHHRMPVVLDRDHYSVWLDNDADRAAHLELLGPAPVGTFVPYPVSTFVNAPANDTPHCIEPLEA